MMTSNNEGLLIEGQCYIGMGIYNDEGPFCETVLNCARSDVINGILNGGCQQNYLFI